MSVPPRGPPGNNSTHHFNDRRRCLPPHKVTGETAAPHPQETLSSRSDGSGTGEPPTITADVFFNQSREQASARIANSLVSSCQPRGPQASPPAPKTGPSHDRRPSDPNPATVQARTPEPTPIPAEIGSSGCAPACVEAIYPIDAAHAQRGMARASTNGVS